MHETSSRAKEQCRSFSLQMHVKLPYMRASPLNKPACFSSQQINPISRLTAVPTGDESFAARLHTCSIRHMRRMPSHALSQTSYAPAPVTEIAKFITMCVISAIHQGTSHANGYAAALCANSLMCTRGGPPTPHGRAAASHRCSQSRCTCRGSSSTAAARQQKQE